MDKESIPFWTHHTPLKSYPPLKTDTNCDVCIIGAGISGLTTAYLLSKSGKKVLVLDDGPVAGGQTRRTTAHLTNVLDDRYHVLENYFGVEGSKLAAESHGAAIDFIESLVHKHRIACEFERIDGYLFTPPQSSLHELEKEFQAAKRAGLKVKMVESAPIDTFDTGPAICFSHQAQFHPLKYMKKLCQLVEEEGGTIHCNTHVTAIEEKKDVFTIKTKLNKEIYASHVVVATNSPIKQRFFPHLKQAAYRTYAISGKIPKGSVKPGLYYDTCDPYHYVRVAKDKEKGDTLIVGGEDHRTGEEKNISKRYQQLEAWALKRFPQLKIKDRWSGQILEPVDCLAFIGRVHKDHELYMITGDSGNGLTHGTLGALLIHDLIRGIQSPWKELYDPHRITLKASSDFLHENLNTALQYKDWLTPGEKQKLKPGCGMVVRKGLKKRALYRDEHGEIHEMSAVCPHLGGIVRWNQSEHCWECPAHGSYFDAKGKVIQSPANQDLSEC